MFRSSVITKSYQRISRLLNLGCDIKIKPSPQSPIKIIKPQIEDLLKTPCGITSMSEVWHKFEFPGINPKQHLSSSCKSY